MAKNTTPPDKTFDEIRDGVKSYLAANKVKAGTKRGFEMEHAYLNGLHSSSPLPPGVQVMMAVRRSLLTL